MLGGKLAKHAMSTPADHHRRLPQGRTAQPAALEGTVVEFTLSNEGGRNFQTDGPAHRRLHGDHPTIAYRGRPWLRAISRAARSVGGSRSPRAGPGARVLPPAHCRCTARIAEVRASDRASVRIRSTRIARLAHRGGPRHPHRARHCTSPTARGARAGLCVPHVGGAHRLRRRC